MSAIALRPSDLTRRMVLAGMAALIVALAVELPQFDANKQCRGGAFSSGFSTGYDVRHCDLVIRRNGNEIARVSLVDYTINRQLR